MPLLSYNPSWGGMKESGEEAVTSPEEKPCGRAEEVCVDTRVGVAIAASESPGQRLVARPSLEAQDLGLGGQGGPVSDSQI